ncbi:Uncharacterized protein dnm_018130 [Desulfonema magnum]|uniref:Uncharacterized protein n=1 Tax=Desulfonema magnum TaxID=45655 RepID=A0A975GMF7_9BACT|nr:Uncharacterized protein dnm_018130 [Desulfonema magnum]
MSKFFTNITFKKRFLTPECQTYSLAIFPTAEKRRDLPNCKFGTPDNSFLKTSMSVRF